MVNLLSVQMKSLLLVVALVRVAMDIAIVMANLMVLNVVTLTVQQRLHLVVGSMDLLDQKLIVLLVLPLLVFVVLTMMQIVQIIISWESDVVKYELHSLCGPYNLTSER